MEVFERFHFAQRSYELTHGFLANITAFHMQRGQIFQIGPRRIEDVLNLVLNAAKVEVAEFERLAGYIPPDEFLNKVNVVQLLVTQA